MSNAMSLKAKIRNIAKRKNIPAQVILQNYMFERLLVRLAASTYKDKFVLKGGMLVAAIVGLDNRATMDLDTTLKNLPLTPEAIRSALEQVAAVPFDDGVTFEVGKISPIDVYKRQWTYRSIVVLMLACPSSCCSTFGCIPLSSARVS